MKSDKYQSLDIFSNTKKPSTPYQPLPHKTGNNSSGSSTPNTPGVRPPKKEFEKKLDEAIKKELERREEEKKKKQKEDEKLRSSFKTPNKIEERRSSGSDKERHSSDKIKDRRSSKNHESSSSKHRHDSEKDKHRRSSSDKERRHSSSSSSSSSSDKKDYKRRESTDEKESRYSKERDQQEKESKRRLQEVRERKEKEEKERKRELERKQSHEKECDKNKPKDEINNLLKKRISSLGVDNIQKMLMESLVEKTGAKISEGEKQKMISKMEEMIKPSKEKVKSPPKKKSPVKKRSVSSSSSSSSSSDSSSSSSSDSESDDELKEMKTRVKEGRKSIETPSSTSRPVRNRKIRTFQDDSEKSDTDSDFIQPVKKEEQVEANIKVNNVAEPPVEAAVKSQPRIAKKDVDPQMPTFNYFTQEDVDKVSLIKDKYEKFLENEDELQVDDVTEEEINDAIPQTRIVSLEIDNNPQKMIESLSQFGGNPRLFTPIPDWLTPYLQGAKVKLEDVEMATKAEVAEYLSKKQTGKRKRKAGWDIVVDWVPDEQPLTKKSKIEKQLQFDFDSSFGCSINVNEGRRSRRSNMKYSDTSFTSEDDSAKSETQEITKKPKRNSKASIVNSIETTVMKMETEPGDKEELQVSPESPLNPEDRAEATSSPTESLDKEETNLPEESFEKEDTIIPSESLDKEETNLECSNDDSSPGKKRRSKDIIAAYLNSAGVDRQEKVESEDKEESQTDSADVLKKLDEEINETDQELEAVLNSLRSKRKRSSSGDSKVGIFC